MAVCIVTGSGGLIGSETSRYMSALGFDVVGIDNDLRRYFFGDEASTASKTDELRRTLPSFRHVAIDIRDGASVARLFEEYGDDISLVVHTAAQPSHDWAATQPLVDYTVNALGTLHVLEATRRHCPRAAFIFTSTNKVYGDHPNALPLIELDTRWEVHPDHPFHADGIDESMSIDQSLHSLFGASKASADLLVQEYGRYFGMHTAVFRGGCLTGPGHAAAELHGFLGYLMKCAVTGRPYRVYGYKGKQVRDNIHSTDLVAAFDAFRRNPRCGEVYNIGGGRTSNVSMIEAIRLCERLTGARLDATYVPENRIGDHIWYISDLGKFRRHYPDWHVTRDVVSILEEIRDANSDRWMSEALAQTRAG